MIKVTKIIETCGCSPTQWSAITDDGKDVYIRFRWGTLRVELEDTTILSKSISDPLDGLLEFSDLAYATKEILDFSNVKWVDKREDLMK